MVVSRSTNAGTSWERDTLSTVYSCCYAIAVDPSSKSNIVYAGGTTGMYKSTDAGQTWAQSTTGLSGTVYDIAVHTVNSNIVYAATSGGVYRSTNAGTNWALTGGSLTSVNDIVLLPGVPDTLYAGTASGVYQSFNGGSSWTAMNTGLADTYVNALGFNPGQRYLFAGTRSRGMYYWSLTVGAEEFSSPGVGIRFIARPNPAVSDVEIEYQLKTGSPVGLDVYDAQGRLVDRIVDGQYQAAGDHRAVWKCADRHGNGVAAGVYFLKLRTAGTEYLRKLLVVR